MTIAAPITLEEFIDVNNRILYVGKAKNLAVR